MARNPKKNMKILFVSKNFEKRNSVALEGCDAEEFVMLIDVDRCISCGACELACQIEHADSPGMTGLFRPIVKGADENEDTLSLCLPSACRHCESPCDYYSPYNFWIICPKGNEQERKIISCDFCINRTQKGLWPACATRCSMKTIYFGRVCDIAFTLGEKRLREMGDVEFTAETLRPQRKENF